MPVKVDPSSCNASAMAGSRSAEISDRKTYYAAYCTAPVEDLSGRRPQLTLQISGVDPQGAFNWSCGNRGLTRVGDLEEHTESPLDDETLPLERIAKWSWRHRWKRMTGPTI